MALAGRTIFVTGGSRGIGLSIALRAAADGANIALAAKTAEPHPKLKGTIYTAAEEVEKAGGKALPLLVDVRDEAMVADALKKTVDTFNGLDIVINNASAINNSRTLDIDMKRYDLMNGINARGTFMTTKLAIPYLLESKFTPHVLNLSPPLNLDPKWFPQTGTAYTMAKFGMSMCVLGHAEEFKGKIAVNGLWPETGVATAAIEMLGGKPAMAACRSPDIMSDAAHWILSQGLDTTGNLFVDVDVLKAAGASDADIKKYSMMRGVPLMPDFWVGDVEGFTRWRTMAEAAAKVGKFFG